MAPDFCAFSVGFETFDLALTSSQEAVQFEDVAELQQKAQATVKAAADLVQLGLPSDYLRRERLSRGQTLKSEAKRLTEAFEEQHRHLWSPRKNELTSAADKECTNVEKTQGDNELGSSPACSALICIGPFKVIRNQIVPGLSKSFINMEELQKEVQRRMCNCFSNMAGIIRSSQVALEAKGQKIMVQLLIYCIVM